MKKKGNNFWTYHNYRIYRLTRRPGYYIRVSREEIGPGIYTHVATQGEARALINDWCLLDLESWRHTYKEELARRKAANESLG